MSLLKHFRAQRARHRDRRDLLMLWAVKELGRATYVDLWKLTDMPSGVIYASMARLVGAGYIGSEWVETGRPVGQGDRRRAYFPTESGAARAAVLVRSLTGAAL